MLRTAAIRARTATRLPVAVNRATSSSNVQRAGPVTASQSHSVVPALLSGELSLVAEGESLNSRVFVTRRVCPCFRRVGCVCPWRSSRSLLMVAFLMPARAPAAVTRRFFHASKPASAEAKVDTMKVNVNGKDFDVPKGATVLAACEAAVRFFACFALFAHSSKLCAFLFRVFTCRVSATMTGCRSPATAACAWWRSRSRPSPSRRAPCPPCPA